MAKRRFEIDLSTTLVITVDDHAMSVMMTEAWKKKHPEMLRPEHLAAHVALFKMGALEVDVEGIEDDDIAIDPYEWDVESTELK